MGFLIKLWNIISTVVVVLPKVWPILKIGLSKLWNIFLSNKLKEKKKEELEQAVKEAKETGDTSLLEAQFSMGEAESVSVDTVAPTVLAGSADPAIEEKKSPNLDQTSALNNIGLTKSSQNDETSLLGTVGKVAAAGFGLYILSSLLKSNTAKAATTSSVIIDNSGTVKTYSVFKGTFRVGSKLLP